MTTISMGSDSLSKKDTTSSTQRISKDNDTSSNSKISTDLQRRADTNRVVFSSQSKVDTLQFVKDEFIKNWKTTIDTTSKSINIFIVGGQNIDVSVSQSGILTVNKTANPVSGYPGNVYGTSGDNKKKGFLSDMDSSKLTSLITLILASIPIIISSIK